MDEARYVIARIVPDILRNEPINVGIIFQSDERIAAKFVPSLPKTIVPDQEIREYAESLQDLWDERLANAEEQILLTGWDHSREIPVTSEEYLQWLHSAWGTFLLFSEPRTIETESLDDVQFAILTDELFDVLVSRRKRRGGVRVSAAVPTQTKHQVKRRVQRAFKRFGIQDQFSSPASVGGRIVSKWSFDWAHLNMASGILIDTVWLGHPQAETNLKDAAYASTKARDVRDAGDYDIHAVFYSPNGAEDPSTMEARALLEGEGVRLEEVLRIDELAKDLAQRLRAEPGGLD